MKDLFKDKYNYLLILIFIIGFGARLLYLGDIPWGINQDEAYAGYEAYSLLNYGLDSRGYTNPVYFVSWGSGMNVLYSYLTIPFILLFGNNLNAFVIRLPQAVFACISLVIFYLLLNKIFKSKKSALIGTFVMAVSPWHIMLAHWGLESNLAPSFILLGLYFWIKGTESSKFFIASAVFYGFSLYCYAPLWLIVPVILILQFAYSLYTKQIKIDRFCIIALVLLILIDIPLVLFLLINNGFMEEIRTPLLSIPRLLEYRGGEVSLGNIKFSIFRLINLFASQNDELLWNVLPEFGLYYKFSIVFIVIGMYEIVKKSFICIKERAADPIFFVFCNLAAGLLFGLLVDLINVNKINILHIPMLICCTQGIITAAGLFKRSVVNYIMLAYSLSFLSFTSYYISNYNMDVAEFYQYDVSGALDFALEKADGTIYFSQEILYPKILFYTKLPVTDYLDSVVYDTENRGDYMPVAFGNFKHYFDYSDIDSGGVYIINFEERNEFRDRGFTVERFGLYGVAYAE